MSSLNPLSTIVQSCRIETVRQHDYSFQSTLCLITPSWMFRRSEMLRSVWTWPFSLALPERTFCPALAGYAADDILNAHSKPVAKFNKIVWLSSLRGDMPNLFSIPHRFLLLRPTTVSPNRVPHPLEAHRVKNGHPSSAVFFPISSRRGRHRNRRVRQEYAINSPKLRSMSIYNYVPRFRMRTCA